MSARERTHEYAVLKALGFSGGYLFALSPSIAGAAKGYALVMGLLGGGFLPAVRAARLDTFQALRAV